jgi:hypothetical protein
MIDKTMTGDAARPVRFGLNLPFANSIAQIVDNAARAADVGFDVVLLGDHLGHQAPLAPLVAIADAVPSVRVGNLVLNAPLYAPALLIWDLTTVVPPPAVGSRSGWAAGMSRVTSSDADCRSQLPTGALSCWANASAPCARSYRVRTMRQLRRRHRLPSWWPVSVTR